MAVDQRRDPAAAHRGTGCAARWRRRAAGAVAEPPLRAVLFDRDGTLVHDVPYNGDPGEGASPSPARARRWTGLRAPGLRVGRRHQPVRRSRAGLLTERRGRTRSTPASTELLGPFDMWQVCPHGRGRRLRLPQARARHGPGAARGARRRAPRECVVVGDIGADIEAAAAAGARVLVPTPRPDPRRPRRAGEEPFGTRSRRPAGGTADCTVDERLTRWGGSCGFEPSRRGAGER